MDKVYFIYQGDYCKIGVSCTPYKRVKQLQTGNPHELELYAVIKPMDAYGLESELHSKFADVRMCGEWFNLPKPTVDSISGIIHVEMEDLGEFESEESDIQELPQVIHEVIDNIVEEDESDEVIEDIEEITETKIRRIRRIVPKKKESLTCNDCKKTFKSRKYLQLHQNKKISCTDRFPCKECGKLFKAPSLLAKHLNRTTKCTPW